MGLKPKKKYYLYINRKTLNKLIQHFNCALTSLVSGSSSQEPDKPKLNGAL